MNKKIIVTIGLAFFGLVLAIFFASNSKTKTPTPEEIVNTVEQKSGNDGSIVVPNNLNKITKELWEKYESVNCSEEPTVTLCEYYTQTKNETGEKSTKNLEWNSLCAYVKKYTTIGDFSTGDVGSFSTGDYNYETLGYEEKGCYQGMYRQN